MIIRDRADEWVMISQHDHADLSGRIASHIKDHLFPGLVKRPSVELAIREHDRAWLPVDEHPIINDVTNSPFSFLDFPLTYKSVIYKHGIDEVEALDPYAALLCSYHYEQFMVKHEEEPTVASFLKHERERQVRLISKFTDVQMEEIVSHFELLKFCDNVSLYICLNEPGITKELEHPFFRQGIGSLFKKGDFIHAVWQDKNTIHITPFPFIDSFEVTLKQKVVSKERIKKEGVAQAYERTPFEILHILMAEKS